MAFFVSGAAVPERWLATRKRSSRDPGRTPLWDDQHPEFRRTDDELPADHHARWLLEAWGSHVRAQAGLNILANNALSIVRALRRRDSSTASPPGDDFQAA